MSYLTKASTEIGKLPTVELQLLAWIKFVDGIGSRYMFLNFWLEDRGFRVYVRKSRRALRGRIYQCLDIARAEIPKHLMGRGRFSAFVELAAASHPWEAIYFESVLNKKLIASFRRRGYHEIAGEMPSFFYLQRPIVEP